MSPRVFVLVTDIAAAISQLQQVDVGDGPMVDALALVTAIDAIAGNPQLLAVGDPVAVRAAESWADEKLAFLTLDSVPPEQSLVPITSIEAERLRDLPPGPCVCAGRFRNYPRDARNDPALHIHPGKDCEACATTESAPCLAGEYVDTGVRTVSQARLDSGVQKAEDAPAPVQWAYPEPEIDLRGRPAPGAWRPGSDG